MEYPQWMVRLRQFGKARGVRLLRNAALGVGIVAAAAGEPEGGPRVPVRTSPEFMPDVEVKKLGGRFVLQRKPRVTRVTRVPLLVKRYGVHPGARARGASQTHNWRSGACGDDNLP